MDRKVPNNPKGSIQMHTHCLNTAISKNLSLATRLINSVM